MTLEQVEENLGRPLRADAERNRRRILTAAAEVFAKRGLEAGLDEIARHAGVGTGTVYRRFPDKAMLIEALFESRLDDIIAMARTATTMVDPWEGLVFFLTRCIEMQQADRGLKDIIFSDLCAADDPRFAAKREQMLPMIQGIMERAQAGGQLRADVAVTDLAVLQFMLLGVGAFTSKVEPDLWRRQFGLLMDGLRADSPTRANTLLPLAPVSESQLESMCRPG